MKRNALAAPFERGFATQKELETKGGQGELMQVHYRDEEAMYIQAAPDRVTVIFSTVFREETDRIFGKVFLQVCFLFQVSLVHTKRCPGICGCSPPAIHPECPTSFVFKSRSST